MPDMDKIELFFWQIYGSEHPPFVKMNWTISDANAENKFNIPYYRVTGHDWLHSVMNRAAKWIVSPVYFKGGEQLWPTATLQVHERIEDWDYDTNLDVKFTLPDADYYDVADAGPYKNWRDLLEKSMRLPIFFRISERSSPIDVWIYQNLILIIEQDYLMLVDETLLEHLIQDGMMNGRYVGYFALPNSAFINFNHAKLKKTHMQQVNLQMQSAAMEKIMGE